MYTYLIGWSHQNKYYYGVRYSKNANPNELWVTYFTSSKYVAKFRKDFGEPDVVQIRKTFNDKKSAQLWEHRVLRRLKCAKKEMWLNKTDNVSIHYNGIYSNYKIGLEAALKKTTNKKYEEIYDTETAIMLKKNRSETSKKNWADPEIRKRMSRPKDPSVYREAALKMWAARKKIGG